MTIICRGQLAGRGGGGPPAQTRPRKSAPRADGRGRCVATDVRRGGAKALFLFVNVAKGQSLSLVPCADGRGETSPQMSNGEGAVSPASADKTKRQLWRSVPNTDGRRHIAVRTCVGEGKRRPVDAEDIRSPRGYPRENITADERRGERKAARRRGRRRGTAVANVAPCGRLRECVAADERRGGEGGQRPTAADAPRETAARGRCCGGRGTAAANVVPRPRADGRAGVSP